MTLHEEQERVQKAVENTLTHVREDPWLTQRVLANAKGEEPVVKKLSVSMLLVIAALIISMTSALAAGLGLFGELAQGRNADSRLAGLEEVSQTVSASLETDDGITIQIGQAYYEGNRVFLSYRLSGNLFSVELHEGAPEDSYQWTDVIENTIAADTWENDIPELQRLNAWLDGKGQRWGVSLEAALHDGLYLEDGTYLQIIGGDSALREDGSVVGWKECLIPEDRIADTLNFKAVLFRGKNIAFQDGTTYKGIYERGENTDIFFTLQRSDRLTFLQGETAGDTYRAAAALASGRIDTKGTVVLSCPAEWVNVWKAWENEQSLDIICDWKLYQDGIPVAGAGTEAIATVDSHTLEFTLLFQAVKGGSRITLVPEYSQTGEHPEEAISIEQTVQ